MKRFRISRKIAVFLFLICIYLSAFPQPNSVTRVYEIWDDQPAPNRGKDYSLIQARGYPADPDWEAYSYPVGNGYMGINVFGRTDVERIQLTEKTLANEGLYGKGGLTGFAEIYLDFGHYDPENYKRSLNLNDGILYVDYEHQGVKFSREYLGNYPENVIAIKIGSDKKGKISFKLHAEIPYKRSANEINTKTGKTSGENDLITLSGSIAHFNVNYEGQIKVINEGGQLFISNSNHDAEIRVEKANSVVILIAAGTNYKLEPHVFLEKTDAKKLDGNVFPHENISKRIKNAATLGYEKLKQIHLEDYQNLFSRVDVVLSPEVPKITTGQLLENYKNGNTDPYLEELMFHYGRYLLISSSRKSSLPCGLQGVWSQYLVTPWTGGYWHNINVQMNYWGAFNTNLAETFIPYIEYHKAYLPRTREAATDYIQKHNPQTLDDEGDNGWAIGSGSTAYVIGGAPSHSGPGTAGFTSKLFWEYFDFTRDTTFLLETGYPALFGASKFLSKTVLPDSNGLLLVNPSASPEVRVKDENGGFSGEHYRTIGTTFDQGFVWENHNDVLKAAKILEEENDLIDLFKDQMKRLDPILIGASGQIKEFREENKYAEIGDPHHRHVSQLCSLYPGTLINSNTPEWLEAARVTLDYRGNTATGWGLAHRMNLRARTKDAENTHKVLSILLKERTLPNLWTVHPPFQIDANLGLVSGIAEMLVQSHEGYIDLLPALPKKWESGEFKGLVARGNYEVSAKWDNMKLLSLEILSNAGGVCNLKYPNQKNVQIKDNSGKLIPFLKVADNIIKFNTLKNERYTVYQQEVKADSMLLEGKWVKVSKKKFEPTIRDVAYGPHERNKLDFWKAESKTPTPLVFYIHGGGWGGGSKEENKGPYLNLLKKGVSYVSINYRLARGENKLPCSLTDAARALQFVRSKAKEWNIDPERIIATGGSAGGCSSLWLAFHDDLANPKSEDPIERESTRLLAAAVISAQTTIDAMLIQQRIGTSATNHSMIWNSVGASSPNDLFDNWTKYKELALECSPLAHLSKDDPPIYLTYNNDSPKPITSNGIHHAEFGRILKEASDSLGVKCIFDLHTTDKRQEELEKFMLKIFTNNLN